MQCIGGNPNCERRRELLSQLKYLVNTMERTKPCEWDEQPDASSPTRSPADALDREPPSHYIPIKTSKSHELRGSLIYRCECIKRNGLQDRCMFLDCMGRPECMTKLYPACYPGRAALLKLTDLSDSQVALEKFYCADRARKSALAAYCRLVCPENSNGTPCCSPLHSTPSSSVAPHYGSAQSSSNRLQPQSHNIPIRNQAQKLYRSPTDAEAQQQSDKPQIQRCHQQQQYHQQQVPQQHCQQQYRQQEPISYSYPISQTPLQFHTQLCSPCMLPTYTQC